MFNNSNIDKSIYVDLMDEIKYLNSEYYSLRKSKEYKMGMVLNSTFSSIKNLNFRQLKKLYSRWFNGVKSEKFAKGERNIEPYAKSDNPNIYFSDKRIAVYSVVFGKYDEISEPLCAPDNIDYYFVTDQDVDFSKSKWKKKDISEFESLLKNMTNAEKNRFFKMHPHLIFPDYEYTIYIDGNIEVISDLTEFVNKMSDIGFAAHAHNSRDCVYDEAEAVLIAKKESKQALDEHVSYLTMNNMPHHYGLLECNVLVRRNCDIVNHIFEEWWNEFNKNCKRDQLSLPYVLFKEGIAVSSVATLGKNVFMNSALRVIVHS